MLYTHHGLGFGFTGNYNEYFNEMADLVLFNINYNRIQLFI